MTETSVRFIAACALVVATLLAAAFAVSDGFLNVDETVYFLGARALAATGALAVPNGWSDFASPDLRIMILAEGPGGLVPQYPAGTSLAGAPLIPAFGQKSLIALNVLAGIGTLFAGHALARRLFGEARVADLAVGLLVFATFWSEYVFGHWPHAISVFSTTLALVLFLDAFDREERAWRPAVLSGLVLGAGLLFRLDGVLLLPAIAAVTILWAARPIQDLAGGAAGVLPMVLVLAATNAAKFGTWNPLSYGGGGGGTNLSGHAVSFVLLLATLAGLVLMRTLRDTAIAPRILRAAPLALVAGLGIALFTPLAPHVWSLARGIRAILLDATTISDARPGVFPGPGGTLWFWGFPKKALVQSLPWLGCLALLAGAPRARHGRSIAIVLIIFTVWALPFLMRSWHGGLGSNMRYLLPTLPLLCALAAVAILDLIRRAGSGHRAMAVGCAAGLVLSLAWLRLVPGQAGYLHQIISLHLFYAVAAASLLAVIVARPVTANGALAATGIAIGLAAVLGVSDFAAGQERRAWNAAHSEATDRIAGPVILYGPPAAFAGASDAPDRLLATPRIPGAPADEGLVHKACDGGYRVVLVAPLATAFKDMTDFPLVPLRDEGLDELQLLEVSCPD